MVKKMKAGIFFFMTGGGFTGLAVGASSGGAAGADGGGEFVEDGDGVLPADAGGGDGLAAGEFGEVWDELLVSFDEVGLDHDGGDGF
jgi:hypothetical protein